MSFEVDITAIIKGVLHEEDRNRVNSSGTLLKNQGIEDSDAEEGSNITVSNSVTEAKPKRIFKPATPEQVANRNPRNPVYPVDPEAFKYAEAYWKASNALQTRLWDLREQKNGGEQECRCLHSPKDNVEQEEDDIDMIDYDADGIVTRYCLKCGGERENPYQ